MAQRDGGKLTGIFIGLEKGAGKQPLPEAELVAEHGLRGDRHAGKNPQRQVSLFSAERLRELQSEGFEVSAEELSANLFTEHIDLDALKPRTQLRIGEAVIEIVERRTPCRSITRIDARLPKRLYGRCGQLGRILISGRVRAGDEIAVLPDDRQGTLQFES